MEKIHTCCNKTMALTVKVDIHTLNFEHQCGQCTKKVYETYFVNDKEESR